MPVSRSAARTPQQRRHFSPTTASRQYEQPHPDSGAGNGGGAGQGKAGGTNGGTNSDPSLLARMLESAATTLASVLVLGAGFAAAGYVYHKFYKALQLKKIENAFKPGDPVLVLAAVAKSLPDEDDSDHWIQRAEQSKIDAIVTGHSKGHYHLIMGEKGSGKSSMLLEAMRKIDGDGCAMFEAHADLEIFRIRLGKALDYEFHEDYIGGYFSERGPRDTTALLDIERALNKLEKVALKNRADRGKPLVIIVNQCHLIRDDEDGKDLLELLQQRAEQWAASNLVTMVFNSDDYWVYERFKQLATRMEVLAVHDLPKSQALTALKRYRQRYFQEDVPKADLEKVYDLVGGRLSFLNRVAKSANMIKTCDQIKEIEKTWFLNQCWILGSEMDDDVMDQQKWAAAAMVLALALVDKEEEMDHTYDAVTGHVLPTYPMHIAQQIMTRADFIRDLDRLNLFTITSTAQVRASSVPMHRAFREICAEPGFRQFLEDTNERIAAIESLGRTRELVAKDLVLGGKYEISKGWSGKINVVLKEQEEKKEDGNDD
ncbi:hypothetical protein PFICI_03412 [Pestalotiopsis fici W106-1]|uniref:Uncharacterized protein n=1 Tax=Pestalotiopsis fici (strain W106-1 / CGMCC3.15140) TaxID=1229662 RepID=W3XIX5_PESFW|nr:uncharacterized protein PFICI_03412 [Pestalotiopsis fici W106-1]ETS85387.1 hypothetical protein PFICI_03412 [Pestalotiopsis fici W106-1]